MHTLEVLLGVDLGLGGGGPAGRVDGRAGAAGAVAPRHQQSDSVLGALESWRLVVERRDGRNDRAYPVF